MKKQKDKQNSKGTLSQEGLQNDVKTFADQPEPHQALETPEGKANGAEPAVFKNQRKYHT
jgi:hypothetical protein